MAKKNVLQNFVNNLITTQESDSLKGGRSNNPINTGSFGFINWDDIDVREPGIVIRTGGGKVSKESAISLH